MLALRSWARFSDFILLAVAREVKFLRLDSASDKLAERVLRAGLSCLLDAVASRPLSECQLGWSLPHPSERLHCNTEM